MTDVERIAEYLKTSTADVNQCLAEPADRASSGHVRALAAMLSDVRREEREACEQEVQSELAEAERQGERMAVKFLNWALKHIKARGQAR